MNIFNDFELQLILSFVNPACGEGVLVVTKALWCMCKCVSVCACVRFVWPRTSVLMNRFKKTWHHCSP